MEIGNKRNFSVIILSILLCFCFASCVKNTQKNETTIADASETELISKLITQKHSASPQSDSPKGLRTLEERTSWNIELSFVRTAESGFIIRICDNDNQGFYYNPVYFVLDYYNGTHWVKLTNLQEALANTDFVYVYPDDNDEYVDTNNLNMFSLVPDFEPKPGKYRITKVLSGKEFSTEFDIS